MSVHWIANVFNQTVVEMLVSYDGKVYYKGEEIKPFKDGRKDVRIEIPVELQKKYRVADSIRLSRLVYESITPFGEIRGRTNVHLIDDSDPFNCHYDNLEDRLNKAPDDPDALYTEIMEGLRTNVS